MEERRIASLPNLMMPGVAGPKEYGVLLTDQRSIFVLVSSSKVGMGAILGGAIGAAIAQAASSRTEVDYENADPIALSMNPKNISIPHNAIQRLELTKSWGSYRFRVEYVDAEGKRRKLEAFVTPSAAQLAEMRRQGVKPKIAAEQYAHEVQEALQRALPPAVAARAEWNL